MNSTEDYGSFNSRNIFQRITDSKALFLCIDALDFDEPKMKLRFCSYDGTQPKGKKITDEVDIFIPIGTFLVLAHDVLTGVFSKQKRAAATDPAAYKRACYFEQFGGTYQPTIVSKQMRIVNGMGDVSFALVATSGAGVRGKNGLIIPKQGVAPSHSVFINFPDQELKSMLLIGKAYIEQYIGLLLPNRLDAIRQQRQRKPEG